MTNKDVVKLLREIAAAYTVKNENRFKIVAYERAADSIEHLTQDVLDIWKEQKLKDIPGIGESIAGYLSELFSKGQVKHFSQVKKGLPLAMFTFLSLPTFGPKKAYKLAKILKIKDSQDHLKALEQAAKNHQIAKIEGFGQKSEAEILEALGSFRKKEAKLSRLLLPVAFDISQKVLNYLKSSKEVIEAYPLGSLRRMVATVGDIDIAISSNSSKKVVEYFLKYPDIARIIDKGDKTSSVVLKNSAQVDIMIEPPVSFGALLQHFTGSKHHNIKLREFALKKGLSLSEHGIKRIKNQESRIKEFETEEKFYNFLGLECIPPELREDQGEIEASVHNTLPDLVKLSDIKGDLHIHSSYNLNPSHDLGENSFEQLLEKASELKYDYIAFSEHNPKQSGLANNEIISIMKRRKQYIDKLKYSTKFTRVKIFNMLEIDILPNGFLALPGEAFEYIDGAIVSIHSSFRQGSLEMTKRILKGLSYPKAKIFGHPTARLLEKREGIDANWSEIFEFCQKNNKALEINANPFRLDLPDLLVHEAIKKGCAFVINTDTHRVSEMDLMNFGVSVARRGWAERQNIINTMGYNEVRKWLVGR